MFMHETTTSDGIDNIIRHYSKLFLKCVATQLKFIVVFFYSYYPKIVSLQVY